MNSDKHPLEADRDATAPELNLGAPEADSLQVWPCLHESLHG